MVELLFSWLLRTTEHCASIIWVRSLCVCVCLIWTSRPAFVMAPSCRLAVMRCWSPTTGACLWCWRCCCCCWSTPSCICPLSLTTTTLWRIMDETSEPSFGCKFPWSQLEYLIGLLFLGSVDDWSDCQGYHHRVWKLANRKMVFLILT